MKYIPRCIPYKSLCFIDLCIYCTIIPSFHICHLSKYDTGHPLQRKTLYKGGRFNIWIFFNQRNVIIPISMCIYLFFCQKKFRVFVWALMAIVLIHMLWLISDSKPIKWNNDNAMFVIVQKKIYFPIPYKFINSRLSIKYV